jgi:plastocyanin
MTARTLRTVTALGAAVLLSLGAAACGSSSDSKDSGSKAKDSGSKTTDTSTDTTADTTTDTTSTTATTATGGGAGKVLDAEVGKDDGFTISMQQDGKAVTKLAAGDYTIKVSDLSSIHNFHLTGPGVDKSTDVGSKEDTSWKVTLKPGTYTYVCDPHASSMTGSFTVA